MPRYDFQSPRLYVLGDLTAGSEVIPGEPAIHYLRNVLRLEAGAGVLVFNGREGEWRARVAIPSKRELRLEILEQTRPQPPATRRLRAGNRHGAGSMPGSYSISWCKKRSSLAPDASRP